MLRKRLLLTLEMIKFEHSVFALPFALTGALLAFRENGYRHAATKILWIIVAMVGARSAANGFAQPELCLGLRGGLLRGLFPRCGRVE